MTNTHHHTEEGGLQATRLTQPLREEHQELLPHIEQLRTVADSIGTAQGAVALQGVNEIYQFLISHLIPHAQAEERALYPVVGKLLGAPEATATMSRDHVAIHQLTRDLAALRLRITGTTIDETQEKDLRRVLYGLYALVVVHFAKEEEIYLPLLDTRLTVEEARHMFESMEKAAQEAKASTGQ
jgi:hemerythrin-like domain-containing protein